MWSKVHSKKKILYERNWFCSCLPVVFQKNTLLTWLHVPEEHELFDYRISTGIFINWPTYPSCFLILVGFLLLLHIWTACPFIEYRYSAESRVDTSFITNHAYAIAIRHFPYDDDSHMPIYRWRSESTGELPHSRSMLRNQAPYIACVIIPWCFGLQIIRSGSIPRHWWCIRPRTPQRTRFGSPWWKLRSLASMRAYLVVLDN